MGECRRIAENEGLLRGRLVLKDLPIHSSILYLNRLVDDPLYQTVHLGQLGICTMLEHSSEGRDILLMS